LGNLVRQTKERGTDSFKYVFSYPKGTTFNAQPNSNGGATGKQFYIIAEPDEIEKQKLKTVGLNVA